MVGELRDFLFRGNVIDLAVAVVVGAAFAAITTSLVEDIITPLLGIIGMPDFSTWTISAGDAEIRIGAFLNTVIWFVLVGASIFFLVVKPMNRLQQRSDDAEEAEAEAVDPEPSEVELLMEIRDELRRANDGSATTRP